MTWSGTPETDVGRPLTPGEKRLADVIFRGALHTNTVKVHNKPYLRYQRKGVAMTPNGEIWFRPDDYLPDLSLKLNEAGWLIRELTHAWQYQTGRSVKARGALEQMTQVIGINPYKYGKLDPTISFGRSLNEQQAAIVEDYFRLLQH